MRLEGWEGRLAAIVDEARGRPYVLGEHDCFRVACRVVEALTGEDLWPRFSGYRTKAEALRYIARHGSSFEACFDHVFGAARVDVRAARRGDLCAIQSADGMKHLGVCLGAETALLADDGLTFYPTLSCLCAWRVG